KAEKDSIEVYTNVGIPAEWAEILQAMGHVKYENLKEIKYPKLHQELCGYKKKNKLEIAAPAMDDVRMWLGQ
ncbi:MAG: lysine--tRNA ligase, partial [Bacteroidales bacterium]|nr:lysine--tRNA ligase [Bacteroidales bacterium]